MNLGRLSLDGRGVSLDYREAYKWFWLAACQGENLAHHYLLELEGANPAGKKFLTPEQISQARHCADLWIQNHSSKAKLNSP
jgi:TPR repeat protein